MVFHYYEQIHTPGKTTMFPFATGPRVRVPLTAIHCRANVAARASTCDAPSPRAPAKSLVFPGAYQDILVREAITMYRTWFALFLACTIAAGARADAPLVKELRGPGSKSGLSVVFCARPGVPGHAMVILGKDDEAKQACTVEAFGFYPSSGTKAVLGPVPGKMADEFLQGRGVARSACRVIVRVDQPLFDKVEGIRAKWAGKTNYRLLTSDCVSFTSEVGHALGLRLPDRSHAKLPVTYIEKLYELNR